MIKIRAAYKLDTKRRRCSPVFLGLQVQERSWPLPFVLYADRAPGWLERLLVGAIVMAIGYSGFALLHAHSVATESDVAGLAGYFERFVLVGLMSGVH